MARDNADLVFCALGGIGEIGMNMALYGYGPAAKRQWLMVDCGVSFAGEALPGIDLVMPDTRFIEAQRKNLLGIVLTHAHEDHFGALIHLWPRLQVPVYATRFTAALLEAKRLHEPDAPKIDVRIIPSRARFNLGPFDIELVNVGNPGVFPLGVIEDGVLLWHARSRQWIIGSVPGDVLRGSFRWFQCHASGYLPPTRCRSGPMRREPSWKGRS